MMKKQTSDGYILILTLLVISIGVIIGSYLFNRGSMYIPFSRIVVEREKAKQLALSGLQVAIAQLAFVPVNKEQEAKAASGKQAQPDKLLLTQESIAYLVPRVNRWQTFQLTEKKDGVEGNVQLCIMSEEGKININHVYDFEKKKFVGEGSKEQDWKVILQDLCSRIEKQAKVKNLFQTFEALLKKRDRPFDDVTELLQNESNDEKKNVFAQLFENNIFYVPPKKDDNKPLFLLYLTDLFTVFSYDTRLNPWMLSDSLSQVLGLTRISLLSIETLREHIEKVKKELKKEFNWSVDWKKFLQPLYQQDGSSIAKNFMPLAAKNFEPTVFSVRCHATVGRITEQLYAIIQRLERADNGQIVYDIKIKRFYWL